MVLPIVPEPVTGPRCDRCAEADCADPEKDREYKPDERNDDCAAHKHLRELTRATECVRSSSTVAWGSFFPVAIGQ